MSERMNKDKVIAILQALKINILNDNFGEELLEALDIAIESLIKQSEYDMYTHNVEFQLKLAEKKLNELGYAFNEYRGCIIAIDKADKE